MICGFLFEKENNMDEVYVKLRFEKDDEENVSGIGFWVNEEQVKVVMDIAKRNGLFMVVEQEYDFTGEE